MKLFNATCIPLIVGMILLAAVALLSSCASVQTKLPTTVQVQVDHYVAVPVALTAPCPIAVLAKLTNGELTRVARERKASLQVCNVQLDAIRKLGQP